jgi:hypothetical protein
MNFISKLKATSSSTYNMEFIWEYEKYCLYLRKSCHAEKDSTVHYRCRLCWFVPNPLSYDGGTEVWPFSPSYDPRFNVPYKSVIWEQYDPRTDRTYSTVFASTSKQCSIHLLIYFDMYRQTP